MWLTPKNEMQSFIKPSTCKIVVWPVCRLATDTVPAVLPIHVFRVSSQNSATEFAATFVPFLKLSERSVFIIDCWAAFLH